MSIGAFESTSQDVFFSHLSNTPSSHNYYDCLLSSSPEYLSRYKYFKLSNKHFFGYSPENNLHYYGDSAEKLISMLEFLKEQNHSTKMIFANYLKSTNESIRNVLDLKPRPFFYLQREYLAPLQESGVVLRKAKSNDQELVNRWYEQFNIEANSNWETPLLDKFDSKLYLLFKDDQFIGAAANTLSSSTRFWVGRMWICPQQRKRGFGSALLSEVIKESNKQKKNLSLLVNTDNEPALALYRKFNFARISKNCIWY